MTDLYVQARILCYLYENYNRAKSSMLPQNLHQKEHLQYVNPIVLKNELDVLKERGYVDSTEQEQQQGCKLSVTGIEKTESLYKNFVEYIKTHDVKDSSYWVKYFNVFDSVSERIVEIFFKIHTETELRKAFEGYLKSLNNISF
jgi:hypothetical protein